MKSPRARPLESRHCVARGDFIQNIELRIPNSESSGERIRIREWAYTGHSPRVAASWGVSVRLKGTATDNNAASS